MSEQQETTAVEIYPLMPLRDIVVFPGMIAPLVVGRKKSIQALEKAMEEQSLVFLVAQKNAKVDEPGEEDLYKLGTVSKVLQVLHLPDGAIKVLVEGKRRARFVDYYDEETYAQVGLVCAEAVEDGGEETEIYVRDLRRCFHKYAEGNKRISKEVVKEVDAITESERLIDTIAGYIPIKAADKQQVLAHASLLKRVVALLESIYRELELVALEASITAKVKKKMSVTQRNYYLGEKIKVIREEMGASGDGGIDLSEIEEALSDKVLPDTVREKVEKELKKLSQMPAMSSETTVVRNYIDTILALPWIKEETPPIDINRAAVILDEDHFGLTDPKERILEYLAVQARVEKLKGPIICLVGPPGVGKTSVCKSIARAIGRKFIRLSLGGVRDEAEIRGHRRTYIGAMPGKIIQSMQKAEVVNPVFCLDEVDKMSMDFRGDPSAALLEVLDPEQNAAFNDHYLDLDYDLSEVFFITTANNLPAIPAPLRDRMEIIKLSGYTEEEKVRIARGFLVPKQLEANGFKANEIKISEQAIMDIVRFYVREAGVRGLERNIATLCRKVALKSLQDNKPTAHRISRQSIASYLGIPKYRHGSAEARDEIGLATGLAWTEVGGELLQIEATLMPGNGKLMVTGKLGDVMQESARAAMSYVRSRSMRLGLDVGFFQKVDLHVHVPEGAIPKDGPSAGITIATSIVSALLKVAVDRQLAMTGEITLRGRVLPIGGLTEKLLAAKRGNITHVLIPQENERDLKEVPPKIRASMTIETVEHMDEVLEKALVIKEGVELFKPVAEEALVEDFTLSAHNAPAH